MSSAGVGSATAMTAKDKLPVLDSALRSWIEGWRAIRAMPLIAAVAFASLVLVLAADTLASDIRIPPEGSPGHNAAAFGLALLSVALNVVGNVLVTPFLIAVHRHVLLKQVTKGYPFDPSNVRFLRFAGFSIVFGLLAGLPGLLNEFTPLVWDVSEPIGYLTMALTIVAYVAVLVVMVRRLVLFPAIAVDASDAGWHQARMLTRGHSWRIVATLIGALLPLLIGLFLLFGLLIVVLAGFAHNVFSGLLRGSEDRVIQAIPWLTSSASRVLLLAALAAVVSHIYRAFDPALGQPVRPIPTEAA